MELATLIARARSGLGKKTVYKSPGVMPPLAASSWPADASNDCSGFLAWCLRISRKVGHPKYIEINGGWFETTAIHADMRKSWGYFEEMSTPKVGSFLVYPDKDGHEGHIGLVTDVNGAKGVAGVDRVIHCSLSGWKNHGDAIRETSASIWSGNEASLIGWYSGVT